MVLSESVIADRNEYLKSTQKIVKGFYNIQYMQLNKNIIY